MHNPPTTEPKSKTATRQAGVFFGGGAMPFFQLKLTVNQPGDAYEQEADHIADKVMRMREGDAPVVQRMFAPAVQRACAHCEEKRKEKEGVQCKETGSSDAGGQATPSIVSDVLSSGGGQAMDANTQDFMGSRMGADFSNVRIHTNGKAAESASAIQARAYTSGNNIVFGQGEYQPGTEEGKRLLAHELVHVGQQGGVQRMVQRSDFQPWPGQTGQDVAGTETQDGDVVSERVQRIGDERYSRLRPSLLQYNNRTCEVTATMEINFVSASGTNSLSPDQFDETKRRILSIGNERLNGWIHIRANQSEGCTQSCAGRDISVRIIAVEGNGPYATQVELGRSYARENAGHIGSDASEWTIWHEMGHIVLGAADEYEDNNGPGGTARPDERVNESDWSIMSSSSSFRRRSMMHARHFSHIAAWLNRQFPSCNFSIVEESRPLLISITPSIGLGGIIGTHGSMYYQIGLDFGIPLDRLRRAEIILGPRITGAVGYNSTFTPIHSLLLGMRAGLNLTSSSEEYHARFGLFGEGGGIGLSEVSSGTLGALPYAEGGGNIGLGIRDALDINLEGAAGVRVPEAGASPQQYYRIGLALSREF